MKMLVFVPSGQTGRLREISMNIEKYTERARGFIQSAQSLAMRDGHQQFSPLHMLKVLLDDSEGLAGGRIAPAAIRARF
jgi:ATP-dependent Clp protease ATP-binding subunit ClpB